MKIIDEKGKLFGLINVIDLTVLLVVALLIVGGARRFKSKPVVTSEQTDAEITFEVPEVRMATVENIVKGDKLNHYDRGGDLGEIIEVDYRPYTEPLEKDGEWVNAEVPEKYTVVFKVRTKVKNNPDVIIAGDEQMRIGGQYRVKNKRIATFGTVMDMKVLD